MKAVRNIAKMKQLSYNHCVTSLQRCFFLLYISCLFACSSGQILTKKEKKALHTQIVRSPIFSKNHTGFALYDPVAREMLCEKDAAILFTPASNTKLFTLYTSLQILGDSIPALRYVVRGDSLIFWGTGDPTLNNPYLPENTAVFDFLKSRKEQLFYCPDNFLDERYGAGWAWDDYLYDYQVEKSALPIYGNNIQFKKEKDSDSLVITPTYFSKWVVDTLFVPRPTPRFKRAAQNNEMLLEGQLLQKNEFEQTIPFKYSDSLVIQLLNQQVQRPIALIHYPLPAADYVTLYSIPTDSVYQEMMQESDNFLAEQLLLLCANEIFDTLNTSKIIRYAKKELLADLPDPMRWVDGSGLSRYNLFTPRTIVRLLEKIYDTVPLERLLNIFPEGGISGTIKDDYAGTPTPFIYAKTGTLSNKHCLSGFLFTKSGKMLIFSFMHNNYFGSSAPLKKEMNRVLRQLYEQQ